MPQAAARHFGIGRRSAYTIAAAKFADRQNSLSIGRLDIWPV
jgi:hypothetical protein